MTRDFLDRERVAEFWNQTRKRAGEDRQTGYLQDEWPAAIATARLRGEWALVQRWLAAHDVPRGACLDVGCGVGMWLERLAGRFERADGIDASSEMAASAQARLAKLGIANASAQCLGLHELPADRRYDFIFVGGVFMYLNDSEIAAAITKLRDLLTPRGLLLLRESTASPEPWYRDKPLAPGLFADRSAPRPPYYCIYRPPPVYRELAESHALAVIRSRPNRYYKIADLTEEWLLWVDRCLRGRLARRPESAERAARWMDRVRWVSLWPVYYLLRTVQPRRWRLNNYWYLCRRADRADGA